LRLELEQHLQRALGDLGLVRRVRGQELAALDQVIDACRNVVAVGTRAEEERRTARSEVPRREAGHVPLDGEFARMVGEPGDGAGKARRLGHV
jgi:hypothetical protein